MTQDHVYDKHILNWGGQKITHIPKYPYTGLSAEVVVTNCPNLVSLEGLPEEVATIRARNCPKLKTLKGGPKTVANNVFFQESGLESLEGLMVVGGGAHFGECKHLTNLHGIGMKYLTSCRLLFLPATVKSHILGIMLIKGLDRVEVYGSNRLAKLVEAVEIIMKHYMMVDEKSRKDELIEVQHELIEAGLEDYAEL